MTCSVEGWINRTECERENKPHTTELQQIEDDDGAGDKQGLTRLNAIDACKDVDGVCAEYRKHSHVDVVKNTCRGSQIT